MPRLLCSLVIGLLACTSTIDAVAAIDELSIPADPCAVSNPDATLSDTLAEVIHKGGGGHGGSSSGGSDTGSGSGSGSGSSSGGSYGGGTSDGSGSGSGSDSGSNNGGSGSYASSCSYPVQTYSYTEGGTYGYAYDTVATAREAVDDYLFSQQDAARRSGSTMAYNILESLPTVNPSRFLSASTIPAYSTVPENWSTATLPSTFQSWLSAIYRNEMFYATSAANLYRATRSSRNSYATYTQCVAATGRASVQTTYGAGSNLRSSNMFGLLEGATIAAMAAIGVVAVVL